MVNYLLFITIQFFIFNRSQLSLQNEQQIFKPLSHNNMQTPIIFLFLSLFTIILTDDPLSFSQTISLTPKQINTFRHNINGRTLTGQWQCIQQLFYQPAVCSYFRIPHDPKVQVNNQVLYQTETFFSFTNQGQIEGFFYSSNGQVFSDRLYLLLFRDRYRANQVIEMDLNLKQAVKFQFQPQRNDTKIVAFKQENLIATVTLYQQEMEIVKYDLSVAVEVFLQKDSFETFENAQLQSIKAPIKIRMFSQSITFGTSLSTPCYQSIVSLLILLTLLQSIFIFLNPIKHSNISKTRSIMFRISPWFILQMYSFIFILSKQYIKLGMRYFDTELGWLIYLGLGNIGLGMLFLRKYEMVLEKFMNWRVMCMAVAFFIGYGLLAGEYLDDAAFWVIELTLMFQLQVVHSMVNGGKGGLPYDLIGFMIMSRLPLGLIMTQHNIFKFIPVSKTHMSLLVITFIVNMSIIFLQSHKGGQFMILNQIIPGYYNYYFTESINDKKLQDQCPICTSPLNKAPDEPLELTEIEDSSIQSIQSSDSRQVTQQNRSKIDQTITKIDQIHTKTVRYMKTPCNHLFHIQCLTRWMQSKLVCPYCRTTLPQLAALEKD